MAAFPTSQLVYGRRPERAPRVSFGIPAYNRPALLAEALAGLAAQTGSTDYEIVVCDDGCLEETRRVVERYPADRISLYHNRPALGPVGNWNRCFELSRGQWVTVLHDDDLLYPWYLETVTPRLRPGLAAVCTRVVQGTTPPPLSRPAGKSDVRRYHPAYFLKSAFTPFPGVLLPRDLAARLGGFDPRYGPLADFEFWYRLNSSGPVEVVRSTAAFYRTSESQWTARVWPQMLRLNHLLRLRIVREQMPGHPAIGRWLARFFTYRSALSYAKRFREPSTAVARTVRFGGIPGSSIPSGWIWAGVRIGSWWGRLKGRSPKE